jgi:NADH-quinone oxidoreductase subunit N
MPASLWYLGPELAVTATVVALLVADLAWARHAARASRLAWLAVVGLAAAAILLGVAPTADASVARGMLSADGFARFFRGLSIVAALCAVSFVALSDEVPASRIGEYLVLLVSLTLGLCLLAAARNLLIVYLAIELVSIPSYVLAAFRRGDRRRAADRRSAMGEACRSRITPGVARGRRPGRRRGSSVFRSDG